MSDPKITLGDQPLWGTDAHGTTWVVGASGLEGWFGSPAGTGGATQRTRGHGSWIGDQWLTARSIAITGTLKADSMLAAQSALQRLAVACSLADTTLTVDVDGFALQATVVRSGAVIDKWLNATTLTWSIQLLAPDPRRVSTTLRTANVSLPSVTGWLTVPLTVPIQITQTVTGGSVSMTSTGSTGGPVRLLLVGPLVNPEVAHEPSGKTLALTTEIRAGQTLVVDMTDSQRRTVTLDGVSRMNSLTQRGWHAFEPGLNTWRLSAASGSGHLTVEARDAWT